MKKLDGQTAIVADSGLGKAITHTLMDEGGHELSTYLYL